MDEQGIPFSLQGTNCEPHDIWCEEDNRPIVEMGSHELILFSSLLLLLIGVAFAILLVKRLCRRLTVETHRIIYRPRGTNRYRPGLSTIQEESMSDLDMQSARSQARGNNSIIVQTLHNARTRLNNPTYTNRQELSPLISSSRPEQFPPTYDEAIKGITSSVGSNTAEQSALPTYIEATTRST